MTRCTTIMELRVFLFLSRFVSKRKRKESKIHNVYGNETTTCRLQQQQSIYVPSRYIYFKLNFINNGLLLSIRFDFSLIPLKFYFFHFVTLFFGRKPNQKNGQLKMVSRGYEFMECEIYHGL